MLSRTSCRYTSRISATAIPSFLLPAFEQVPQIHPFSTSATRNSRIGSAPIPIPPEVQFTINPPPPLRKNTTLARGVLPNGSIHVSGPLGEASMEIPSFVTLKRNERGEIKVIVDDKEIREHRAMWGTTRSYIQNHVLGVSEGHVCILRFVGVGYRATIEKTATTVESEYEGQQFVNLKIGYSHPVELGIPKGVKASTPQPTRLLLEGVNKHVVTQFAANIRKWRVPEPYKGKGIFVNDETIKLKSKKIK